MPENPIQDLLPFVQKPSRYMGTEINRIQKDASKMALSVALAFPDLYEIGSSHFGTQILYHVLNQRPDIVAERVFAPDRDFEKQLRNRSLALMSLENQRPLNGFDILGFSLLYELNFTNVINMIDLAGLPLYAMDRDENRPLVIAGGPCVCNPEPMAEFFDAMVFGDAEELILKIADAWLQWKKSGEKKIALLHRWADLEGVYVPRFFKATYDAQGRQHLQVENGYNAHITRSIISDMDSAAFPDQPIMPFGKPVHDRLRLEISRGCSRGCRFCQAGMIYRPVRERKPKTLLKLAQHGLAATGYEDMSLLSLSTGDYSCLGALMEILMQRCQSQRVAISLPSLRAGVLTPRLMTLIRSVRKTGFTIAPEAGSQRLRDVINKNITYDDVACTVQDAFALGWRIIKLYFMIGLPTETDADIDAIVDMVKKLKRIKGPNGRTGQINVSVTTFVPKSHTPFQWAAQISLAESQSKIAYLKSEFEKIRAVRFKWQSPGMSLVEGVLARGDRRLGRALVNAWKNGCVFDGWTDQFKLKRWLKALESSDISADFFTHRERTLDDPLPWDHMVSKIDPEFLKSQYLAAEKGERIKDCRHGNCHNCGVCDFKILQPLVFDQCPQSVQSTLPSILNEQTFIKFLLTYKKMGPARFFGHLEIARHFIRAVRRARIDVKYSKGYHPMPKISFDNPLPLGVESESENMRIMVASHHTENDLLERINPFLPPGLKLLTCRPIPQGGGSNKAKEDCYIVELANSVIDSSLIDEFINSKQWDYTRRRHKGRSQQIDLKTVVTTLLFVTNNTLQVGIKPDAKLTARPADILRSVFQLSETAIQAARVRKLRRCFNAGPASEDG
jgi:radical SAM family uncharacterized protein/radical SAM-linked protein